MDRSFEAWRKPGFISARGGRPRNESGPVEEDAPGEKTSFPLSDAGIEGEPRFLLIRFREDHRLVRSSPAGLSPGRGNSLTSKECLFYFGLLCKFDFVGIIAVSFTEESL
jgi:hypothetical protein